MKLLLSRDHRSHDATLGKLYVDGVYECETLEDTDRRLELAGGSAKVPGATCIPRGSYVVILSMSARFGRELPLLVDVPFFSGIRIHAGNTAADTEGCILVGSSRRPDGSIGESRAALGRLLPKLRAAIQAGGSVRILVQ